MLSFETGRGVFETLSRRRRPDHPSVMQKQSLSYFYSRATELSVVEVVRTTTHLIQSPCCQRGSQGQDPAGNRATRRPPDHRQETQTAMVWICLPFIRSAKTILQGTAKGGRRQGGQKKEVGRQQQGMATPGIRQISEGSGEQRKIEETGCEIICGAPTTLAAKG